MHFSVGLLVKKKEEKDIDLTQFMLPFTIPAWCLLLSSCIVVTFIVHLVDKHSPYGWRQTQQEQGEDGDEFNLFNSFWFCMACMLTQGADNTPRNLSGMKKNFGKNIVKKPNMIFSFGICSKCLLQAFYVDINMRFSRPFFASHVMRWKHIRHLNYDKEIADSKFFCRLINPRPENIENCKARN